MSRLQRSPTGPWRWGIVLLLILAVPMRLHSLDRSLWLDETWVANSLLQPDLASVFYYEAWLQTTPPLFLLLERLVIDVLPLSNATFRLLPLLFGILGLAAMAGLALRLLRPPAAFVVLMLFVFAPGHVIYSQTLKQYTSDVFVALVLMGIGLAYLHHRSPRVLLAGIGAFAALAGLSYNAILFMPAFLYGAVFAPPAPGGRLPVWHARWTHAFAIAAVVAASAAINYFGFIRPNLDSNITGGSTGGTGADWTAHVLSVPADVVRLFKHFFFNMGTPWGGGWLVLLMAGAALVAFLGLVHLCARAGRGRPSNLDRAAVLALPIAAALALHVAGFYPLEVARLNLFLLPATLLLFGIGLQALVLRGRHLAARRPKQRRRWFPSPPYAGIAAGLAMLLALRVSADPPPPYFGWHEITHEDAEAAVAHLAEAAAEGDVIYVETTMLEPVKLYTRFTPIEGARRVQGRIGWPCCPRGVTLDRPARPERALPAELERVFDGGLTGTLWTLHTGRPREEFVGADYPALFDERLRARGCRRVESPGFSGVQLNGYQCPPGAKARAANVEQPPIPGSPPHRGAGGPW